MPLLKPRKRFGQHFIRDPLALERIMQVVNPKPDDVFLEIGPGEGALTKLLFNHLEEIHAVEIDRELCSLLETQFGNKLKLHRADILNFDLAQIKADRRIRIIGNLPYNISSPLLFHLFDQIGRIRDMHFMLQLEVAQRLSAEPGNKAYSKLSVISACMANTQLLFEVGAEAFSPPPKVTSAFVRMTPMPQTLDPARRKLFNQLIHAAFSHKRKTLAGNLSQLITPAQLAALGIQPKARPENVSVKTFVDMLKYLDYEQ